MPIIYIDGSHPIIQEHLEAASEYVLGGKEDAYKDIAVRPFNTIVLGKRNSKIISMPEPSSDVATLRFNVELGPKNLDLLNGLKILGGQFQLSAMWIIIADGLSLQHPTSILTPPAVFHAVEQKRLIWQVKREITPDNDHILGQSYQDFFRAQWQEPQSNPRFPNLPASDWWAYERFADGARHPVPIGEDISLQIQSYCRTDMPRQEQMNINGRIFEPFMKTDVTWDIRKSDGIHPVLYYMEGKIDLKCHLLQFKSAEDHIYSADSLPAVIDKFCYQEGVYQPLTTQLFHSRQPSGRYPVAVLEQPAAAPEPSIWGTISNWLWPTPF